MTTMSLPEVRDQLSVLAEPFSLLAGKGRALTDEELTVVATMLRQADMFLTLVAGTPEPLDADTVTFIRLIQGVRRIAYNILAAENPDQAWFWTEGWQARLREADAAYADGRYTRFGSDDEFLAALAAR